VLLFCGWSADKFLSLNERNARRIWGSFLPRFRREHDTFLVETGTPWALSQAFEKVEIRYLAHFELPISGIHFALARAHVSQAYRE
jgi:hypothetical protein